MIDATEPPRKGREAPGPPPSRTNEVLGSAEDEQAVTLTLKQAEVTALLAAGNYVYTRVSVYQIPMGSKIGVPAGLRHWVGWLGSALSSAEAQIDTPQEGEC